MRASYWIKPQAWTRIVRVAALGWGLLLGSAAFAAEPIDTDGPDFVESSEVVPRGRFQYELDVSAFKPRRSPPDSPGKATTLLLKYGLIENFELRIQSDGYVQQGAQSGRGDTAFGIKWHSQDRDAAAGKPAVSWILHFDTATGTRAFQGHGTRPNLRSVITWDLPHDLALGLMPGIRYDARTDGHRYPSAIFGAVLNKRITGKFRAFIEMSATQIARASNGGVLASWDVGVAYLVTPDTQIGARAGLGANQNSPKNYVLFELAQRF